MERSPFGPSMRWLGNLHGGVAKKHHPVIATGQPLSLSCFVPTGSQGLSRTVPLPQREWLVVPVIHDAYGASLRSPLLSADKPDGYSKLKWPNYRSRVVLLTCCQRDRQLPGTRCPQSHRQETRAGDLFPVPGLLQNGGETTYDDRAASDNWEPGYFEGQRNLFLLTKPESLPTLTPTAIEARPTREFSFSPPRGTPSSPRFK